MKTVEEGVMVMKDGKAWGITYSDGHATEYGWINPADKSVQISNPECCKKTTDVTYRGSSYFEELSKGEIVAVIRETIVKVKIK